MQEITAAGKAHCRDFLDVIWQIAERRVCDEIIIRYECGHNLRADVWVPALPSIQDYGVTESERRRFMQHGLFVLTRDTAATNVQITVPETRCRHCGRGQRQTLVCGHFHVDVSEGGCRGSSKGPATLRKLELPLSSHTFLAAMGQVCRLPMHIAPRFSGLETTGSIRPFDGPALPREVRQWDRKEVEMCLDLEVMKYVCFAFGILMAVLIQFAALSMVHLGVPQVYTSLASSDMLPSLALSDGAADATDALKGLRTVNCVELTCGNMSWLLSVLTVMFHRAVAPAEELPTTMLWHFVVHPLWVCFMSVAAPVLFVIEVLAAVPRLVFLHVFVPLLEGLVLQPIQWLMGNTARIAADFFSVVVYGMMVQPVLVLYGIPVTNPMFVAISISSFAAVLSAPQSPSLSLPTLFSELPQVEFGLKKAILQSKSLGPIVQLWRSVWASRKDGRSKAAQKSSQTSKNSRDRHASGRDKADSSGRSDKPHSGRREERAAQSVSQQTAPACFVCLDRPSHYVLEPCGHRVVCGDCAMQLVDAAASVAGHHERGAGACPSCGQTISRAMRLFA